MVTDALQNTQVRSGGVKSVTPALGRLGQENCQEFEFSTCYRMKHHLKNKHQPINNNKNPLDLRGKSHKSHEYSSATFHMFMCSCGYQADWEKASVSYIPDSSLCPQLSISLPQRTITLAQPQVNFSIVKLVQTAYRSWFLYCFFRLLVTCYLLLVFRYLIQYCQLLLFYVNMPQPIYPLS